MEFPEHAYGCTSGFTDVVSRCDDGCPSGCHLVFPMDTCRMRGTVRNAA
ncbi:hypothetical protein HMPREF9141_0821 [Prevotella multiformis DSM 16608]|uniref:Uncharacterized protein n=1 Tax=Prevotella multiformis DSM 16608 TaxID=888743 RepID=F0F5F5_9BACT|nr:hypothetical protein HMPREF9141_0821 [Prevotella multiformis DSM 16608]